MKKFITYDEEELKSTLIWIDNQLSWIKRHAELMKEQHDGKRSNIDMSISIDILKNIQNLEESLTSFKIKLN